MDTSPIITNYPGGRSSKGLLALACGTFALGIAEFSMMGILSVLAANLHISIPQAGDFISAYALGVSVGAPLPVFFRKYPLKYILLGLCVLIAIGNSLAASSPGYNTLLIARFISGLPHGGFFGVSAIVAVSLVEPGRKATAVAVMVAGMTVANVIGVPTVTWLTYAFSWRYTFLVSALSGVLAFVGIAAWIPRVESTQPQRLGREFQFLKGPAPWLIFIAVFLGQGSVYCWYSYMEPIMLQVGHVPSHYMKWVMTLTGLGMFCGGLVCGKLADKYRPALVCAFTAMLIIPTLLTLYFFSDKLWIALPTAFIGTAALFGLGGIMQYLIVRFSRGGEILGGAGIQISFNLSNACAAFLGGLAIKAGFGLTSPALIGIPLAVLCVCCLSWFTHKYKRLGA